MGRSTHALSTVFLTVSKNRRPYSVVVSGVSSKGMLVSSLDKVSALLQAS
jgi:hypothetical protein